MTDKSEPESKVTSVVVEEIAPLDSKAKSASKPEGTPKASAEKPEGSSKSSPDKAGGSPKVSGDKPKKEGPGKGRRIYKKNNQQNNKRDSKPVYVQEAPEVEEECHEFMSVDRLEQMTQRELLQQVRRLESILYKEQMRRESAVMLAQEAKQYADAIKEQVARRVQDVQQTMQATVQQLQLEIKIAKKQAEEDLLFYREQLQKANDKLKAR